MQQSSGLWERRIDLEGYVAGLNEQMKGAVEPKHLNLKKTLERGIFLDAVYITFLKSPAGAAVLIGVGAVSCLKKEMRGDKNVW